jgi:imidazolonepropionase-like amidohydrolase
VEPADIIFFNGSVLTMEAETPVAEALAVTGGVITAVGSADDVLRNQGPGTLMVDLEGGALLPGFIDSHAHWIGDREIAGVETPQAAIGAALRDGWTSISEQFVNQERLDELVRLDEAGELLIGSMPTFRSITTTIITACGSRITPLGMSTAPASGSQEPKSSSTGPTPR